MSGKSAMEQFNRIRASKNIIPGIHNYCDRWCERCVFTDNCSVYAMGEEEDRIRRESTQPEKELAEYVGGMLQDAMELLRMMAEENGMDLDAIELDEADLMKPDKKGYLVRKATEHANWLFKWFKNNGDDLDALLEKYEETSEKDYLVLKDAIEVLRWFIHFIAVKFTRASMPPWEDSPEGRSDMNGSAKTAIIAVNRSIAALAVFLKLMPGDEDELLNALVRLERIRKRALRDYPGAMEFRRPGLDD